MEWEDIESFVCTKVNYTDSMSKQAKEETVLHFLKSAFRIDGYVQVENSQCFIEALKLKSVLDVFPAWMLDYAMFVWEPDTEKLEVDFLETETAVDKLKEELETQTPYFSEEYKKFQLYKKFNASNRRELIYLKLTEKNKQLRKTLENELSIKRFVQQFKKEISEALESQTE